MRRWMLVLAGSTIVVALAGWGGDDNEAATATREVAVPGGEILFTRLSAPESKRSSLFRVAADGTGLRLFVRDAADAAVSPDGRRLAFVRGDAIWLMGRDGSHQEQLTRPPAGIADSEPAWSADGRTIFFTREKGAWMSWWIVSVRVDGTGLRRLTKGSSDNRGGQSGAAPSPKGSVVAYTDYSYGGGYESESIEAMTVAGRTTKLGFALYSSADVEYTFDPAWAPDSRRLAFGLLDLKAVNEEDRVGQSGVYVSTSAKAAPRRIARPSRVSEDLLEPAWSADGRWVAFEARAEVGAGYRSRIWLVRDNGTALRRVTSGKADSDPVWLPSSSGR